MKQHLSIKDVINSLHPDVEYFYLPFGIGDTLISCRLINSSLEYKGRKIIFLVQQNHTVILQCLHYSNFVSVIEPPQIVVQTITIGNVRSYRPACGKIYVSHPMSNPDDGQKKLLWSGIDFLSWYKYFYKIYNAQNPLEFQVDSRQISLAMLSKIRSLTSCPLKQIVCFYPHANSMPLKGDAFWNNLYSKIKTNDNFVFSNEFISENIPTIQLSIADSLSLGSCISHIYAIRSGICDLLQIYRKKLTVFYTAKALMDLYSINRMVGYDKVDEILI